MKSDRVYLEQMLDAAGKVRQFVVGVDRDDVLTPAEAKLVRRGEAQLKRGESKPWREVKRP